MTSYASRAFKYTAFSSAGLVALFGATEHIPPRIRRRCPPTTLWRPGHDPDSPERVIAFPGMQGDREQIRPLEPGFKPIGNTLIVEAGSDVRQSAPAALRELQSQGLTDRTFVPVGVSMGGILDVFWLRLARKAGINVSGAVFISAPMCPEAPIWPSSFYKHGSKVLGGGLQSHLLWLHMNLSRLLQVACDLDPPLEPNPDVSHVLWMVRSIGRGIAKRQSKLDRSYHGIRQLQVLVGLLDELAKLPVQPLTAAAELLDIRRCMNIPASNITSSGSVLRQGPQLRHHEFSGLPALAFERRGDHRVRPNFDALLFGFPDARLVRIDEPEGHADFTTCWEQYTGAIAEWRVDQRRGRRLMAA